MIAEEEATALAEAGHEVVFTGTRDARIGRGELFRYQGNGLPVLAGSAGLFRTMRNCITTTRPSPGGSPVLQVVRPDVVISTRCSTWGWLRRSEHGRGNHDRRHVARCLVVLRAAVHDPQGTAGSAARWVFKPTSARPASLDPVAHVRRQQRSTDIRIAAMRYWCPASTGPGS